jgi:hypothetical protein
MSDQGQGRKRSSVLSAPKLPHGEKGRLGVLMAETEDGTQGLAKKSTPVSNPLLPHGEKGESGRPDA